MRWYGLVALLSDSRIKFLLLFIFVAIALAGILTYVEAKLRKKSKEALVVVDRSGLGKMGRFLKEDKTPREKLDFVNRTAKEYFKELYGMSLNSSYSFLIENFKKHGRTNELAFCKAMFSTYYSYKELTDDRAVALGSLLVDVVRSKRKAEEISVVPSADERIKTLFMTWKKKISDDVKNFLDKRHMEKLRLEREAKRKKDLEIVRKREKIIHMRRVAEAERVRKMALKKIKLEKKRVGIVKLRMERNLREEKKRKVFEVRKVKRAKLKREKLEKKRIRIAVRLGKKKLCEKKRRRLLEIREAEKARLKEEKLEKKRIRIAVRLRKKKLREEARKKIFEEREAKRVELEKRRLEEKRIKVAVRLRRKKLREERERKAFEIREAEKARLKEERDLVIVRKREKIIHMRRVAEDERVRKIELKKNKENEKKIELLREHKKKLCDENRKRLEEIKRTKHSTAMKLRQTDIEARFQKKVAKKRLHDLVKMKNNEAKEEKKKKKLLAKLKKEKGKEVLASRKREELKIRAVRASILKSERNYTKKKKEQPLRINVEVIKKSEPKVIDKKLPIFIEGGQKMGIAERIVQKEKARLEKESRY